MIQHAFKDSVFKQQSAFTPKIVLQCEWPSTFGGFFFLNKGGKSNKFLKQRFFFKTREIVVGQHA